MSGVIDNGKQYEHCNVCARLTLMDGQEEITLEGEQVMACPDCLFISPAARVLIKETYSRGWNDAKAAAISNGSAKYLADA